MKNNKNSGARREAGKALRDKRREESKTLNKIVEAVQMRLEEATKSQTSKWREIIQKQEYRAEQKVFMSVNNTGLREGVLAGLATFLTLRWGPAVVVRLIRPRRPAYRLDPITTTTRNNPFEQNKTSLSPLRLVGIWFLRGVKLGLDVFCSLLVGSSTSYYFTDMEFILSQAANLPLVEGRSFVSDEFCQTIQREIAQKPPSYWKQIESPLLKPVVVFERNCRLRQAYEQKLMPSSFPEEHPPIPSPGVPTDYMLLDQEGVVMDDNNWTDKFVTDQDEESK